MTIVSDNCTINVFRSIIDDLKSVIDYSRMVMDDLRVTFQLTIVIFLKLRLLAARVGSFS